MIRVDNTIELSTRKGDIDMIEMTQYRDRQIEQKGREAMLQAQVEAMGRNIAELRRALSDVTAELRTANARAVTLAADLSAATQTADELRWQLRLANRRDAAGQPAMGEWERLARTLVDSAPCGEVAELWGAG